MNNLNLLYVIGWTITALEEIEMKLKLIDKVQSYKLMYWVDRNSQVLQTRQSGHSDQKQACHLVSYENDGRMLQRNQNKKIKLQHEHIYIFFSDY